MWIESMNSSESQCFTEGLQMDKAGLSTKFQSHLDTENDFYVKSGMTLASKLAQALHVHSFG